MFLSFLKPDMDIDKRLDRAEKLLSRFNYKPNVNFKIDREASRLIGNKLCLQIKMETASREDLSKTTTIVSRELIPSEAFDQDQQFLDYMRKELHDLEIHESDEFIRFDGKLSFDPHKRGPA